MPRKRTYTRRNLFDLYFDKKREAMKHNAKMVDYLRRYMLAHPEDELSKGLRGAIFRELMAQAAILAD